MIVLISFGPNVEYIIYNLHAANKDPARAKTILILGSSILELAIVVYSSPTHLVLSIGGKKPTSHRNVLLTSLRYFWDKQRKLFFNLSVQLICFCYSQRRLIVAAAVLSNVYGLLWPHQANTNVTFRPILL